MINFVTTLALLFLTNLIQAQYKSNCIPQDLIVTGEDVNFRIEPNTNSTPKGKLVNGELLKFIALEPVGQNDGWNNLNDAWIKVKRISTVEEGYVFGKYVKPQEMAYHYSGDCDRIQNGFWYGIYQEGNKVFMVETKPKLPLIFAGDLNNDGIPEVIFSEATTKESAMYYFMSNPEGKLELKSVSYSSSKC